MNYLLNFLDEATKRMLGMAARKNADYSGAQADDPFFNFTAIEKLGIASVETGIMVRMLDKFARVQTFVKTGILQVQDEKVEDTLLDLANYALILAAYVRHKKHGDESAEPEEPSVADPLAVVETTTAANGVITYRVRRGPA